MLKPFDKRDGLIWLDGKFVEWSSANVHFLNHGLHYASFVYEGIRVYNGKPFLLKKHIERLLSSAKKLGMHLNYSLTDVTKVVLKLIEKNKIVDGYLRPAIWRGSQMMQIAAPNSDVHFAVAVWSVEADFYVCQSNGVRLKIADHRRHSSRSYPYDIKSSSLYMVNTIEKHNAISCGYDDVLFLDLDGNIAEASGANIFFIKDQSIFTPKKGDFFAGLTRSLVLKMCDNSNIKTHEVDISVDEANNFDFCFITGTATELKRIHSIGDHTYNDNSKVFDELLKKYRYYTTIGFAS